MRHGDDSDDESSRQPKGRRGAASAGAEAPEPPARPSEAELDAMWARLFTKVGFPRDCPRAACRRNRTCRPASGLFACWRAYPEAVEALKRALVALRNAGPPQEP